MKRNRVFEDVNEAFFWKHLADSLLEHSNIDKRQFYDKVRPIKYVWDFEGISQISDDITLASKDKTKYIKEKFGKVISDFKKGKCV